MSSRRPRFLLVFALLAGVLAACDGSRSDSATQRDVTADDAVTVGSFDFAESELLAEIYSQALEGGGFRVERVFGLGPREFVWPALARGLVELVPEYAGTALQFLSLGRMQPTGGAAATHEALVRALESGPVTALSAAPGETANTFVVTHRVAEQYGLRALSDVAAVADELVFGGPPECVSRPLCLLGLRDMYGIVFKEVVRLDAGGPVTRQELTRGAVDMALLFTSDPVIATGTFVELRDDRGLQPAENVTPLVRREVISRFGSGVTSIVDAVSRHLTTPALRLLNAEIGSGSDVEGIAARWLEAEGLR
jgi:osmoprotectant transport system substrate-binding protein